MMYFLIVLNLLSIGYLLIRSISDFGKLNYYLIFAIFNFLYGFAIPFEMVIFQKPFIIYGHLATRNQIELVLFLSTLSNYGFYLGLLLSIKEEKSVTLENEKSNHPISIFVLLLLSVALLLIFNRNELIRSFSSYSGNFTTTYANPIYAFNKEILFSVLAIVSLIFLQKRSKLQLVPVLITIVLILFGFYTKDKNPILMASIPWIWIILNYFYRKITERKFIILLIFLIGIAIIPIFNSFYGSYRGKWDAKVVDYYITSGLFIPFESSAVMLSLIDVTNSNNRLYGNTYLSSVVNWIPKSIWKQRPESLAESYAKFKMKDEWDPGKGFGFSLLAESYLNFGILGAFIQYFLIGLLLGLFKRLTYKFFYNHKKFAEVIFFIWAVNELVLMHRGQFNMPSSYIRYLIPLYMFYLVFERFKVLTYILTWKK